MKKLNKMMQKEIYEDGFYWNNDYTQISSFFTEDGLQVPHPKNTIAKTVKIIYTDSNKIGKVRMIQTLHNLVVRKVVQGTYKDEWKRLNKAI